MGRKAGVVGGHSGQQPPPDLSEEVRHPTHERDPVFDDQFDHSLKPSKVKSNPCRQLLFCALVLSSVPPPCLSQSSRPRYSPSWTSLASRPRPSSTRSALPLRMLRGTRSPSPNRECFLRNERSELFSAAREGGSPGCGVRAVVLRLAARTCGKGHCSSLQNPLRSTPPRP